MFVFIHGTADSFTGQAAKITDTIRTLSVHVHVSLLSGFADVVHVPARFFFFFCKVCTISDVTWITNSPFIPYRRSQTMSGYIQANKPQITSLYGHSLTTQVCIPATHKVQTKPLKATTLSNDSIERSI